MTETAHEGRSHDLQRGAVGFGGVLFQSVTFMAPAIATAISIPAGIAFSDNTIRVFGTHYANNPDYQGFSGIIAASVFTLLAFIGFEEAAPIAEEERSCCPAWASACSTSSTRVRAASPSDR